MKKFYKSLFKVNSTPAHLGTTLILSLVVMFFINIFIGSVGGIAAMLAFFIVYYIFRAYVLAGRRIGKEVLLDDKSQIKYLLFNYCCIYMIIWTITRTGNLISKMSGWGNVRNLGLKQYMESLYGTTMMERWAYIFAGILMFSFIVSLFPLVVIRTRKKWLTFLFLDLIEYGTICFVIQTICRKFIDDNLESKAFCVINDMLLCRPKYLWQTSMYIVLVIVLAVAEVCVVYIFCVIEYEENKNCQWKEAFSKRFFVSAGIAVAVVIVLICIAGVYFFAPAEEEVEYKKVAECLTEDSILGPMVFEGEVYIPVNMKLNFYEEGTALGYLGYKDQNCESRFYKLAVANLLYDSYGGNHNMLQLYGADYNSYCKASIVENFTGWENDEVFLMWDEQWSKESVYGSSITGYTECSKEFVKGLEDKFGAVEYNAEDFYDADAYFTISGYSSIKEAEEADKPYGDWVGCILIRDNIFYYGNYDNPINGILLNNLLQLLSGK